MKKAIAILGLMALLTQPVMAMGEKSDGPSGGASNIQSQNNAQKKNAATTSNKSNQQSGMQKSNQSGKKSGKTGGASPVRGNW